MPTDATYSTYSKRATFKFRFRPHIQGTGKFSKDLDKNIYTPQILKKAYSVGESQDAKGMRIAVICAFDNASLLQSLEVFCKTFAIPLPKVNVHYPYGRSEVFSRSWILESCLDSQYICAFAQGADIDVVFAKDSALDDMLAAVEFATTLLPDVVCMCFGSEEPSSAAELGELFKNKNCIFASSSGDTGGIVSFPSTSPFVVSVGGTHLVADSNGNVLSETAWKNGGGGSSEVFEMPFFQQGFVKSCIDANVIKNCGRATPDTALAANFDRGAAVYSSTLGGWTNAGGTSLACACFSGVCALIKKYHPGVASSTLLLSFLYSLAGDGKYDFPQRNFRDVVLGKSGDFFASPGWDFCTGLGALKLQI